MTAVPSTIVVGPYTYTVVVDQPAIDRASYDAEEALSGNSDHARQEIAIVPDLGPDALAEVLMHEAVHAVLDQSPLGLTRGELERVAYALGYGLVDLLRRNPKLVEFVTSTGATRPTRASGRSRHGRTDGRQRAAPEGP